MILGRLSEIFASLPIIGVGKAWMILGNQIHTSVQNIVANAVELGNVSWKPLHVLFVQNQELIAQGSQL